MDLILDANALSAVAEGQPAVVARFASTTRPALPVIVLGEYRFGIAQSRHKIEYERWLNEIISASRVLEVDEETSVRYAELRTELSKQELRFLPMTYGLQPSAASTPTRF